MSFDDDFAISDLRSLYDTFGTDGTVRRDGGDWLPVRIVIDRGQARLGEYGTVVGLVDTVSFMCAQWSPTQGDVVRWTDRFGSHEKTIEGRVSGEGNDGLEAKAVLHG